MPCETVTLPDVPSPTDEFTTDQRKGGHERLAEVLSKAITTQSNGKSVAVLGPYGSGKSTVFSILQKKLGDAARVVYFDAWEHSEDPPRQAFLREFVEQLKDVRAAKTVKKKIARLHFLRSISRSDPAATMGGIAVWVAVSLFALGLYLTRPGGDPAFLKTGVRVLAVAAFLWASVAVIGVLSFFTGLKDQASSLLGALRTGGAAGRVSESYALEPTAADFREALAPLFEEATKDKPLVLIVDNLDRLPAEAAKSTWSTVRTLMNLDKHGVASAPLPTRFWVCVGLAPEAMNELWGEDLAEQFLSKAFELRFPISPPLLTKWKKYFFEKMKTAFPEHQDDPRHQEIYRLFQLGRPRREVPPTPREIKSFINQIGALHRLHHESTCPPPGKMPLSVLAYHVLLRERVQTGGGLLDVSGLDQSPLGRELMKGMHLQAFGAVHHGVTLGEAEELLMENNLAPALTTKDVKRAKALRISWTNFWEAVEEIVRTRQSEWAKEDPPFIGSAAYVVGELSKEDVSRATPILRTPLADAISKVEDWSSLDGDTSRGIVAVLKAQQTRDARDELIRKINSGMAASSTWKQLPQGDPREDFIRSWFTGAATLFEYLLSTSRSWRQLREECTIPADATNYIFGMGELVKRGTYALSVLKSFRTITSIQDFAKQFTDNTKKMGAREVDANVLGVILSAEQGKVWAGLLNEVVQRAKSAANAGEIIASLRVLVLLAWRGQPDDPSPISVPLRERKLAELLKKGKAEDDIYAILLYLAIWIGHFPLVAEMTKLHFRDNSELLDRVTDRLAHYCAAFGSLQPIGSDAGVIEGVRKAIDSTKDRAGELLEEEPSDAPDPWPFLGLLLNDNRKKK